MRKSIFRKGGRVRVESRNVTPKLNWCKPVSSDEGGFIRLASFRVRWLLFVGLAVLAMLFASSFISHAYAAGGLELELSKPEQGAEEVHTQPYPYYDMMLQFSKNVSFVQEGRDGAFVENNKKLIHLLDKHGNEVEGFWIREGGTFEERTVMYIEIEDWLYPYTEYFMLVEPGIMAANGEDVTTEQYLISFKTGGLQPNGLTLPQNVAIAVAVVFVLLGIAIQILRIRKNRQTISR